MAVYIVQMGTSTSVAKTLTAMTGSPFSPLVDGRLKQVIVAVGAGAATALIETGRIRLTSTSFGSLPLDIPFAGGGLRTAPAFPIALFVVDCDLPVKTGVTITVQVQNITADTPVTPEYQVYGVFEGPMIAS